MTVVPQSHDPSVELDLGAFTRRLNSGLIVPQADEETTAPIDIVDRHPGSPMPRPRPPVPPPAVTSPLPQPTPPGSTSDTHVEPPHAAATKAAPVVPAEPSAPRRRLRDALVDFIDARAAVRTKKVAEDEPISGGAFAVICLMTLLVASLAFALSFDMMYAAAKHYGWGPRLAALFPVIIDVGAIGGTFMGAISANSTYRRIGHQVLVVTLAASVLFNLVGHDIKGNSPDLLGAQLPEQFAWTGTVAAILIPLLLAYFVHAFSKALKTFADQKRTAKAAAAAQRRRDHLATERQRPSAPAEPTAAKTVAPVGTRAPVAKAALAPRKAVKPQADGRATKADAVRVGVAQQAATPAKLRDALVAAGYTLPSSSTTVENWCKDIKAQLASTN